MIKLASLGCAPMGEYMAGATIIGLNPPPLLGELYVDDEIIFSRPPAGGIRIRPPPGQEPLHQHIFCAALYCST